FLSVNRNKNIHILYEKGPIPQLAAMCGVLVENYLSRKLDQMGLDYDHVHKAAPRLVYCSISGTYFCCQKCLKFPSFFTCFVVQDGDPVRPGVVMTDLATGLYTNGAIMAALLQRHRTGGGVHIDCNLENNNKNYLTLLLSQVACFTHIATNYLNSGKEARRWGTAHENIRCSATSMLSSHPGFLHS
uniref:Succinyl-CoA:glutarate-CoA transferase n=1 Tax=Salmo trutta TaxID=8032 RepID=A0A673XLL6_SALTR